MAVTKRIFQMAKEFECDEKKIMDFLAKQGIKVSNRLSAVNEETYNMLKEKFMAPPPPPEPEPEPEPAPEIKEVLPAETPAEPTEQPQPAPGGKKKKKKNKQPQSAEQPSEQPQEQQAQPQDPPTMKVVSDEKIKNMGKRTQTVLFEGIMAGNEFIQHYTQDFGSVIESNGQTKPKPTLTWNMDTWGILYNMKFDYPDSSPVRYWQSVAKLMTRAFKLLNAFGLKNKEALAQMRDALSALGKKYEPREVFTDEENQKFAEQQQLLFQTFGHGMGLVNDNLYDLKLKAERMKVQCERVNFLDYATNPKNEFRGNDWLWVPFDQLLEMVVFSARGVVRRFKFYYENKERIDNINKSFFEWLDGYAQLKEQGADAAKLEKYLELEEKFVAIAEFMSFDNNLVNYKKVKQGKSTVFDTAVELLQAYRDNLDDPDAERNFKYKIRGLTNILYKPKEFVFMYRFGDLEPHKDYRPPEEIAAAEAKAAAEAAEQEKNPVAIDEA